MTGRCGARICVNDRITDINYGWMTSLALDPVEKKPLKRFHPGEFVLSVGSYGCNMHCPFCQNADISQTSGDEVPGRQLFPGDLVRLATEYRAKPEGNIGIAFTYNEPLVGYEFVYDTARAAKQAGLETVIITNGQIEERPLTQLLPHVDAWNIDLKAWNAEFYRWCGGDLDTTKHTIKAAASMSHVEVTTLIIPGKNDKPDEMEAEAAWLEEISPDIPLHITRYFPRYRTEDIPATPIDTIDTLADIAKMHLKYVYKGNC